MIQNCFPLFISKLYQTCFMATPRIFLFLVLLAICSCNEDKQGQIEALKSKYTPEAINYFYQVAFHSEADSSILNIAKWEKDIYWHIEGDTLPGDYAAVLKVMNELNALQLPISFYETTNRDSANYHILFGTHEELGLSKSLGGFGSTIAAKGVILKNSVKIPLDLRNVLTTNPASRTNIIFEEVIQGLRLPGDSFDYPESVFYERTNHGNTLPELDKQLIRLLYEPAIISDYSLAQYEKDFGEILYHVNSKRKFLNFLRENQLNKALLSKILESGIPAVTRFSAPTNVFISGEVYPEFTPIIDQAIGEINEVSENLNLVLMPDDSLTHREGIYIDFVKDTTIEHAVWARSEQAWMSGYGFPLKTRRSTAKCRIMFKDHEQLTSVMKKVIPNVLYTSLCIGSKEPEAYQDKNGDFELKPEYRDILKIYYDHSLSNGFTKEELAEVISALEKDESPELPGHLQKVDSVIGEKESFKQKKPLTELNP